MTPIPIHVDRPGSVETHGGAGVVGARVEVGRWSGSWRESNSQLMETPSRVMRWAWLACPLPGRLPLLVSLLSVDLPHLLCGAPKFPVIGRGIVPNIAAPPVLAATSARSSGPFMSWNR